MKRNIFILLIVASILIVFSTLIFASGTIDVKDYIKGKFPMIFNIYLAPLGELDEYEKEFIDLLQNLPEEEQKTFAKEVYNNGFFKDILEKIKKENIVYEAESEVTKEEIGEFLSPVEIGNLGFIVESKPFRFIGANAIYLGFYNEYGFSIDEAIKTAKENGITVLRIYLGFGTDTWSGKPLEEYDKVFDIAAKYGVYVIPTLTDCCCLGGSWGRTPESYFHVVPCCNITDEKGLITFERIIKNILLRRNTVNGKIYRDDTTILAWDIANELALQQFTDSELNTWLINVVSYTKSIDPNHLVTIGIDASRSLYNSDGPHYKALNVPGLDFFSFHYNLPNYRVVSQHLKLIKFRTKKFISIGKPVVLEEFGVGSQRVLGQYVDNKILDSWLQAYKQQMDTAFSAGASGVMFWGWGVPETKTVPLWWRNEDHDITEIEFCTLIREYQIP